MPLPARRIEAGAQQPVVFLQQGKQRLALAVGQPEQGFGLRLGDAVHRPLGKARALFGQADVLAFAVAAVCELEQAVGFQPLERGMHRLLGLVLQRADLALRQRRALDAQRVEDPEGAFRQPEPAGGGAVGVVDGLQAVVVFPQPAVGVFIHRFSLTSSEIGLFHYNAV